MARESGLELTDFLQRLHDAQVEHDRIHATDREQRVIPIEHSDDRELRRIEHAPVIPLEMRGATDTGIDGRLHSGQLPRSVYVGSYMGSRSARKGRAPEKTADHPPRLPTNTLSLIQRRRRSATPPPSKSLTAKRSPAPPESLNRKTPHPHTHTVTSGGVDGFGLVGHVPARGGRGAGERTTGNDSRAMLYRATELSAGDSALRESDSHARCAAYARRPGLATRDASPTSRSSGCCSRWQG